MMRYSQAEKMEIIRTVEESKLPVRQTLRELDVPRSSFYEWYARYERWGYDGLAARKPETKQFWNRIPEHEREQVVSLARQALAEARGARRLNIVAHPEDAKLLSGSLASLGVAVETVRLVPDATRARGSLRIETDIGVLDADLAPQLDRLALRLRETLANGE